jgi:hypothetical protein
MNLGDKLIFDTNDATNPNTTYLTNPTSATNPNNTIEVWCNGTKRAEFQNTKLLLSTDIEFTATTPSIRCPHSLTIALGTSGTAPAELLVTSAGTDIFSVIAGAVTVQGPKLSLLTSDGTTRVVETPSADIEFASSLNVNLRANMKGSSPSSKVRVYDDTLLVASMESAGVSLNVNTSVTGTLTVSSVASAGSLLAGSALVGDATFSNDVTFLAGGNFAGKVDANTAGIRTKTVTVNPSGGASGDVVVRTDTSRLWVNVAGTWKSVVLS